MICNATGKLFIATTTNSSEIENFLGEPLADLVESVHVYLDTSNWSPDNPLLLLNKEELRSKQKEHLDLLEKDNDTYVAVDFFRPLAIEMIFSCKHKHTKLTESISLFLPRRNEAYPTLVRFNGLNFVGARISPGSEPFWQMTNQTLRMGPLRSWANLEFELLDVACTYEKYRFYNARKTKSIHIVLSSNFPVPRPSYRLVMVLDTVESIDSLTRFVQLDLNNPTARFVEEHVLRSVSWKKHIETITHLKVVKFESESPFSNKTLQFIQDSCRSSYSWTGLFDVTDRKVANEILGKDTLILGKGEISKNSFSSFWSNSGCPVQTGIQEMKLDWQISPNSTKIIATNLFGHSDESFLEGQCPQRMFHF